MKSPKVIILSLIGIALLGAVSYFAFYLPHVRNALAANQQACADLEPIFKQNYSELSATSTNMETTLAFEHHFSTVAGKCYIKVQRHDGMAYSYTSVDKTILYDTAADKTVANCVTFLERGTPINTTCNQGDTKITEEEFNALEQEYMQR